MNKVHGLRSNIYGNLVILNDGQVYMSLDALLNAIERIPGALEAPGLKEMYDKFSRAQMKVHLEVLEV